MIQPAYVTFEQAKKLKEKGFDVKTSYNFDLTGEIHHIGLLNHNDSEKKISHPEQWQVVEWGSLVHNIEIEARPVRYAGDIKTSYYQPYINGCIVNMSRFATRQEALSEAINEFLKMI